MILTYGFDSNKSKIIRQCSNFNMCERTIKDYLKKLKFDWDYIKMIVFRDDMDREYIKVDFGDPNEFIWIKDLSDEFRSDMMERAAQNGSKQYM